MLLVRRHDGDAAGAGRCWSGCGLLTGCVRQRLKAVAKADYSFRTPSLSLSTSPVGPSFRRLRVLTITHDGGFRLPLFGDHGPYHGEKTRARDLSTSTSTSLGMMAGTDQSTAEVVSAMAQRQE